MKQYRKDNPERMREYSNKWYANNADKKLEQGNKWRKANPDKVAEHRRKRWAKPEAKEWYKAWIKTYKRTESSQKVRRELDAAREILKKRQSLSNSDRKAVKEFYRNCPEGKTVDHILPLRGVNVSGLHVSWNMQYLSPAENSKKKNKFDGTYENTSWQKPTRG